MDGALSGNEASHLQLQKLAGSHTNTNGNQGSNQHLGFSNLVSTAAPKYQNGGQVISMQTLNNDASSMQVSDSQASYLPDNGTRLPS
jgi:hypothetical protein